MTAGVVMVGAAGCTATPTKSGESPTAQPQTVDATTPAGLANPAVGAASVPDDVGDGSTADIRFVSLTIDNQALTVLYELSSALPTAGTALLSLTVESQDGIHVRQLGVKWINGSPQVFVFDFATSQQSNLAMTAQKEDTSVRVLFPVSAIAGLGESFEWYADSNVDGKDVDRAPNADRAKFPELP